MLEAQVNDLTSCVTIIFLESVKVWMNWSIGICPYVFCLKVI